MNDRIRYFFVDVDGTLTDSGIYYDEHGNEIKKFSTRDAAAFFALQSLGIKTAVITGRECLATQRRLRELKVDYVYQNVRDKYTFLQEYIKCNSLTYEMIGYIGDDLNDFSAMQLAGFKACPSDACREIQEIVDYKSKIESGKGAVRDIVEYYLKSINKWNEAVNVVYKSGI